MIEEGLTPEEKIKQLEIELDAKTKTVNVLIDRVEKSLDSGTTSFSLLQNNIYLENMVQERTKELEAKNEKMKVLAREAERANQAKSEFLANMSHDIRTPMHAILGYLEILDEKTKDEESKEFLNIVSNSGKHLLNIINDILDYSKAEAGKIELDPQPIELSKEVFEIGELFKVQCQNKGIKFRLEIDPDLPSTVILDGLRIKQVLNNLLSNAIKFTEENKEVSLRVFPKSGKIFFEVEDQGIGMTHDGLKRIFQAFTQAEESTTRKYGGTGLGLAISRKLVELMGGELHVQSTLGKGSSFSFSIDLHSGPNQTEQPRVEIPLQEDQSETLILVVEDNVTNQKLMAAYLKRLNYSFEIAKNGEEALFHFDKTKYDLILMDENMPILSGMATTEEIRKREENKNLKRTPIIALTANAIVGDRERFLAAGMDEYLAKPLSKASLDEMIKKVLG